MSAPFCAALAWARGDATLAGLTDFRAADLLELVPRITIVADAARPATRRASRRSLRDGVALEWEERDAEDAYRLTWDTACRMVLVLTTEVGVAHADAKQLMVAVRELDAASGPADVVDAMRSACRAASDGPRTDLG